MFLILNDHKCKTAGATLTASLKQTFQQTAIISANHSDFLMILRTEKPSVIILPEIQGETNYYPTYLGNEGKHLIRRHVHEGALYVGFCCGAWTGCAINRYEPLHGPHKYRDSQTLLELTPVHAKGPIPGHGKKMRSDFHTECGHSCELVPIVMSDNHKIIQTHVWYENGPLFHIDDRDVPKNSEVLARYILNQKYPAAALMSDFGYGGALLSGVLPHLHQSNGMPQHPLWNVIVSKIREHNLAFQSGSMLRQTP